MTIKEQHFSLASRMAVTSFGKIWPSPDAAEGESSSTRTSLGVRGADTAPANSPSAPWQQPRPAPISGAGLLTWSLHPCGVDPAELPILAAAPRPVPFAPALIAALPREPGCFYRGVRAAAAVAGGLRGWGPPAGAQTSSGCAHNGQGAAFEKQGEAAWPPWGTSKAGRTLQCRKSPCVWWLPTDRPRHKGPRA